MSQSWLGRTALCTERGIAKTRRSADVSQPTHRRMASEPCLRQAAGHLPQTAVQQLGVGDRQVVGTQTNRPSTAIMSWAAAPANGASRPVSASSIALCGTALAASKMDAPALAIVAEPIEPCDTGSVVSQSVLSLVLGAPPRASALTEGGPRPGRPTHRRRFPLIRSRISTRDRSCPLRADVLQRDSLGLGTESHGYRHDHIHKPDQEKHAIRADDVDDSPGQQRHK